MPLTVVPGPTITAASSLSSAIDLSAGTLARIFYPRVWTPAVLTFQVSADGADFFDLYDVFGKEVSITVVPGACIRISFDWTIILQFVKFRSGSRDFPVDQPTQCDFSVALYS